MFSYLISGILVKYEMFIFSHKFIEKVVKRPLSYAVTGIIILANKMLNHCCGCEYVYVTVNWTNQSIEVKIIVLAGFAQTQWLNTSVQLHISSTVVMWHDGKFSMQG